MPSHAVDQGQSATGAYRSAFQRFRAATNEADSLLEAYQQLVLARRVRSLLDIGVGDGSLAAPLAGRVSTYIGVERDPEFVARLRRQGLDIRNGDFPLGSTPPLDQSHRFDLVLLSHVLSYTAPLAATSALLHAAWQHVHDGGAMLTVTHRGEGDDFDDIVAVVDPARRHLHRAAFRAIWATVSALGPTRKYDLVTHVRAGDPAELLEMLAFTASNGDRDRRRQFLSHRGQLLDLLTARYACDDGSYAFPMLHKLLFTVSLGGLLKCATRASDQPHQAGRPGPVSAFGERSASSLRRRRPQAPAASRFPGVDVVHAAPRRAPSSPSSSWSSKEPP